MSKKVVKTTLLNPPPELWYCWGDPCQHFPVGKDGTVEGLTPDHPRWHVLVTEWKLVIEDVGEKADKPIEDVRDKKEVQ